MESLQKALSNLRLYYKEHGGPNYPSIVDSTGLSESTVQRYLGTTIIKNPNYSSIISIATAIGMETTDLSINRDLVEQMDKQQLTDLVLELRKINIEELNSNDSKWRERLDSEQQAHRDEVLSLNQEHSSEIRRINAANAEHIASVHKLHADQIASIHDSYRIQIEQMRKANEQQVAHALETHQAQSAHIQNASAVQLETLKKISETQKAADEKSKDYLRRQVLFWRVFSILIITAFILLLIADVTNPTRGWIRFISDRINLTYHSFG